MPKTIQMTRSVLLGASHRAEGAQYTEDDAVADYLIGIGSAFEVGFTRGLEVRFVRDGNGNVSRVLQNEALIAVITRDGDGTVTSIQAEGQTISFQIENGITEGVNVG